MASNVILVALARSFNGSPAGGSGTIAQWAYTVPAGKWARVTFAHVRVNANGNAVNTTGGNVNAVIGGTTVELIYFQNGGGATTVAKDVPMNILLNAGDSLTGNTFNTGAGAVGIVVSATIEEHQ